MDFATSAVNRSRNPLMVRRTVDAQCPLVQISVRKSINSDEVSGNGNAIRSLKKKTMHSSVRYVCACVCVCVCAVTYFFVLIGFIDERYISVSSCSSGCSLLCS